MDTIQGATGVRASVKAQQRNAREELRTRAGKMRDEVFGNKVFVRGVVEVSNFCRQNCTYCGMRRDNRTLSRFRLEADRLAEYLIRHRPASLTDISIQAGEDPVAVERVVVPLVRTLRNETNLGITVSLGILPDSLYAGLQEAGASYYVIKLETANPDHYARMQAPGTLDKRLAAIHHLAASGWYVSSGFIVGLPGEEPGDMEAALQLLHELPLVGCSVSPFIPGGETPLASAAPGSVEQTIDCLARMRLLDPERIIPAVSAMTIEDPDCYSKAIHAGANLATINLTPEDVREDYVIYRRDRSIMTEERILGQIARAGCEPSPTGILDALSRLSLAG